MTLCEVRFKLLTKINKPFDLWFSWTCAFNFDLVRQKCQNLLRYDQSDLLQYWELSKNMSNDGVIENKHAQFRIGNEMILLKHKVRDPILAIEIIFLSLSLLYKCHENDPDDEDNLEGSRIGSHYANSCKH